jgi:hypothetical protein
MYGIAKLTAIIANERLVNNLVKYGYAPSITLTAFHTSNTIHHIGVKAIGHAHDADHLVQTFKSLCTINT